MKILTLIFLPLCVWGRIEIGEIAIDLHLPQQPFYQTRFAAAYRLEEECYLVLRRVNSREEGKKVLRKLEKKTDNLQFSRTKMTSGTFLEIGIFLDPFLYSWIVVGKVQGFKGKYLVSLLFFREDRATVDYFSFMERLKILAV